jgi:DNA-binding beta-propeller fold protein YncE
MSIRFLTALCFLVCRSFAAENELAGPVLGFVFDPADGLHSILGMAGASTLSPPLDLSGASRVAISPRQNYALAVSASNPYLLRVLLGDGISVEQLGIPISTAGLIALSPTGSTAAVHDRDRNRIGVITGLPASATLAGEFDLSTFPGALASLAVSDDASVVIASFSDVEESSVVALRLQGPVQILTTPRRATAAAFLPGSRDVLIADGPASEIYMVRDAGASAESTLLAGDAEGITEPTAVGVSRDGKRAFMASSRDGRVATVDLATGAVTIIPCTCSPTDLAILNGNAVFRLTAPTAGPLWLLDAEGPEPRIVFVPPYRPVTAESGQ